jgi:diacylglycerol kinase
MDRARPFSLVARLASFRHAGAGLWTLLLREHNARIHALATVLAVVGGGLCGIERWEWGLVTAAIGLVWTAEALNASVEQLADALASAPHPAIGRAKDLAAGAVLVSALGAACLGLIVFGPRLGALVGMR